MGKNRKKLQEEQQDGQTYIRCCVNRTEPEIQITEYRMEQDNKIILDL